MVTERTCSFCGQLARCSTPFEPAVAPNAATICGNCTDRAIVELVADRMKQDRERFDEEEPITEPGAPGPIRRMTPERGTKR